MFQGVLFDLDGVITDTAEYHYLAWKKLADSLGITIDRAFNEQLKGISREESLQLILAKDDHRYTPTELAQLAQQKNEDYVEMIQSMTAADVYPGIKELLLALKEHHIKIALASASKNGPALLEKMGLSAFFDTIVDPAQLKKGKPEPEIFLRAAEQLDLPPQACIGIEDSTAGITAIKASQALPIGVGKAEDLGENIPVVSSTEALTYDYLVAQWQQYHSKQTKP